MDNLQGDRRSGENDRISQQYRHSCFLSRVMLSKKGFFFRADGQALRFSLVGILRTILVCRTNFDRAARVVPLIIDAPHFFSTFFFECDGVEWILLQRFVTDCHHTPTSLSNVSIHWAYPWPLSCQPHPLRCDAVLCIT